jgi:stress-induced morphogen
VTKTPVEASNGLCNRRPSFIAVASVVTTVSHQNHLIVRVISEGFLDKSLLDRHRMVYQALAVPMKDGRIHALEISAKTKTEAEQ